MFNQLAFTVESSAGPLPGIFHLADKKTAVIFVNGGAQTRVGPHRMYTNLSYKLQEEGFSSFRFDLPGYGDAPGNPLQFFEIGPLLHEIAGELIAAFPHIEKLVYFGLCDGATAILLSNPATINKCGGIILVNPWARQPHTHATTLLKHYYLKRIMSFDFWRKFTVGSFNFVAFLKDIKRIFQSVARSHPVRDFHKITQDNYLEYAWKHWNNFKGDSFLFIAQSDLTAAEFLTAARKNVYAKDCIHRAMIKSNDNADHTFSSSCMQHWLQDEFLSIMRTTFN